MRIPRLLQAALVLGGAYLGFILVFDHLLGAVIPASLLTMYMFFVAAGVFMVFTFDEKATAELVAPVRALVENPAHRRWRNLVFAALPVLIGTGVYLRTQPGFEAPVELRTIHPAPPSSARIFGRRVDLMTLENPFRKDETADPELFAEHVAEGAEVYIRNCQYCHGDKLDGRGPFAAALNPTPANFQDIGTIAQLQESFLFWRIATGGPGLPKEAAPWISSMPVWQDYLKEDEIWKVILFLYDYTGHQPRSWDKGFDPAEHANHANMSQGAEPAPATAATPVAATDGGAERGAAVYAKRCLQCHGEDGDGLGPAAERLNPPPRDFTAGLYKFKTTPFDEPLPNDADLRRMIRDGMPGTAMPGWSDILSEPEIEDVLAYVKTFAELEGAPEAQLDFGTQVPTSAESIATGKRLFAENDRCVECHGAEGRGDGAKRLKDDNGDRTWPRNLTKPWTFRASNDPRDIFARISIGIPTTQMPSFADPRSNKALGIEDRWHVANYVASLARTIEVVRPENSVVQVLRAEGALPASPDDPAWAAAPPTTFAMVPQLVGGERFFTTANDTITARGLYDDAGIALLLEWDDRTRSIPGDAAAAALAEGEVFVDAVAVQVPQALTGSMEKPYFLMGDPVRPVTLWRWSGPTAETPEKAETIDARGIADLVPREGGALTATGSYRDGTWRVVMRRPLAGDATGQSIGLEIGQPVPVAFFAWDGSNRETGTAHAMTTWYWLMLRPADSNRPLIWAALAALLSLGGLVWWGASAARRAREASR